MISVTAKKDARKWVKERLKRHPGLFVVEIAEKSVSCWQGEISIMLKNVVDGWSGWFPINDITMKLDC